MPDPFKVSDHVDGTVTLEILTEAMRRTFDGTDWTTAFTEARREARRALVKKHAPTESASTPSPTLDPA